MKHDLIVIGASYGGAHALRTVLSCLTADHQLPIVIVQHRDKNSNVMLSSFLRRTTAIKIEEAEDKTPIRMSHIYLAPADYHLFVECNRLVLSTDDPVNYARPSIDVAFDSAARAYGPRLVGIVLTGASKDGAEGARQIESRGGLIIIQDPATAEMATLPAAAVKVTANAKIMQLEEIGEFIAHLSQTEAENGSRAAG